MTPVNKRPQQQYIREKKQFSEINTKQAHVSVALCDEMCYEMWRHIINFKFIQVEAYMEIKWWLF